MAPDVLVRGYEEGDRGPVVRLLARCLAHDRMDEAVFADRILRDPDFDAELNLLATAGEQIIGFVAGAPANAHLQCPAGVKLFAVEPGWRQRGVATCLFDELEARLRATGAGHAVAMAAGNNRLTQGLDVRYTAALCFLAARGYERTGVTQDMMVDLGGKNAPIWGPRPQRPLPPRPAYGFGGRRRRTGTGCTRAWRVSWLIQRRGRTWGGAGPIWRRSV